RGADENLLCFRAEQEPAVLQRLDHVGGERIAARGDGADRRIGVAERVGGESGKRALEVLCVSLRVRAGRAGENQAEGEYERDDAFVRRHLRLFPIPAFERRQRTAASQWCQT